MSTEPTQSQPATQAAQPRLSHHRVVSSIYGLIVCAATIAATAGSTGWQVTVFVLSTLLVYWAAESYAHVLALRTVRGQNLGWSEVRSTLVDGWSLVAASYLPLLALLIARVIGATSTTAAYVALVVTIVLLYLAGVGAGRASGLRGVKLIGSGVIAGLFGVVMVVLKWMLH